MKVLHVCSYYIGSMLWNKLITGLDDKGIEQVIYVPVSDKSLFNKNINKNLKSGSYIYSKAFGKLDQFLYFNKIKKIVNDMLSKIDMKDIDIMHAHSLFVNGGAALEAKKRTGKGYITAVRNTDVNVFFKYRMALRDYGIQILLNADKVVFISPAYKNFVLKYYVPDDLRQQIRDKSVVIPNGIDDYWFHDSDKKGREYTSNSVKLITASELTSNKNIQTVVKVVQGLRQRGYDVSYKVYGKGSYRDKLQILIKKLKLEDHVKLMGHTTDKKLLEEAYTDSDIFIMPSKHETFGLVYIEAMSCGTPVIYSKGQGIDGYFPDGGVGYAVYYKDIEEIMDRIEDILINYQDISKRCIDESKKFTWADVSDKYAEIYKNT